MSHAQTDSDLDRLLVAIRNGDGDAFTEWARAATPRLAGRLRPFASRIDTDMIVQETLLRVWTHAGGFVPDGRRNALLRFAFRTARNLAIDELRRTRREPQPIEDVERLTHVVDESASGQPDPALRRILAAGMAKLPPRPRAALGARLGRRGALPDSVLAAQSGMRLNTFVQNVVRARRLLAAHLAACGADPAALLGTAHP